MASPARAGQDERTQVHLAVKKQAQPISESVEELGGLVAAVRDHLVKTKVITSQYELAQLIREISADPSQRWLYLPREIVDSLSDEIILAYSGREKRISGHTIRYALMRPFVRGQMGVESNVLLVLEPYWYGDAPKYTTIEVGCKHEYREAVLGRCYRRGTCEKCGSWYEVDSGD